MHAEAAKNVIAYLRVSTDEKADSGAGLDAQRATIEAESTRHDWNLTWIEDAGYSAKDLQRPGITEVLAQRATPAPEDSIDSFHSGVLGVVRVTSR